MKLWIVGIALMGAMMSLSFGQNSRTVWRKANEIVIDVKLENATLETAVDRIRALSREADNGEAREEWKGIRIGFDRMRTNEVGKRVSLDLKDVSLADALEALGNATGRRVDYFEDGVVLRRAFPGELDEAHLVTRWFEMPPETFDDLTAGEAVQDVVEDPFIQEPEGAGQKVRALTAQELLENRGVEFGEGAWARYVRISGLLVVRNTISNLELVEAATAPCYYGPRGLRIRFDIYSMKNDAAMRFSEREAEAFQRLNDLRNLVEKGDAKWEGSPEFKTRSGQRAKLESGRIVRAVSHYQTVEGKDEPVFESTLAGSSVEVDPVIHPDGLGVSFPVRFRHCTGDPEIRSRTIKLSSGAEAQVESVVTDEISLETTINVYDGETEYAGSLRGKDGRTYYLFVKASIFAVERDPVLPK